MKRAILRASFLSTNCSGSKPLTSAAIWQAKAEASKLVMRSTPLLPASKACQVSSALLPTAQMTPIPVTTTRRSKLLRSFRVRVDVVVGVLDGADLLRVLVGDLDLEGLLEGHDQFDGLERIGAEIVYERGIGGDLAFLDPELLHDDLLYAFLNGCHVIARSFPEMAFRPEAFSCQPSALSCRIPARGSADRYFLAFACWSM